MTASIKYPRAYRWRFEMRRGADNGRSVDDWAHRLVRLTQIILPKHRWMVTTKGGDLLSDKAEAEMGKWLAHSRKEERKGRYPLDDNEYEIHLAAVDTEGVATALVSATVLTKRPAALDHWADIYWPQSSVDVTFLQRIGKPLKQETLAGWCSQLCWIMQPHWGYMHGEDAKLLWSSGGGLGSMPSRGKSEYGLMQVGWLTYLADNQFPPLPSTLVGAKRHPITGYGTLLEVNATPWRIAHLPSLKKYLALRRELLRLKVVRPPVAAMTDRKPYWKKHGLTVASMVPENDGGDAMLPPTKEELEALDADDGEVLEEVGADGEVLGSAAVVGGAIALTAFAGTGSASADKTSPARGEAQQTALNETTTVDALTLKTAMALPFSDNEAAPPPLDTPTTPAHAQLGATALVNAGELEAALAADASIVAAAPLPLALNDYASLVAHTEQHGPAHSGVARRSHHQQHGITDESHRVAIDAHFRKHFRQHPDVFSEYIAMLAKWRAWMQRSH